MKNSKQSKYGLVHKYIIDNEKNAVKVALDQLLACKKTVTDNPYYARMNIDLFKFFQDLSYDYNFKVSIKKLKNLEYQDHGVIDVITLDDMIMVFSLLTTFYAQGRFYKKEFITDNDELYMLSEDNLRLLQFLILARNSITFLYYTTNT